VAGLPVPGLVAAILLAGLVAVLSTGAAAAPAWKACLECHDQPGLTLVSARGEVLGLTVSASELAGSAHRGLECRQCHSAIRLERHPASAIPVSVDEWRAELAGVCLTCHPRERLAAKAVHAEVALEAAQPRCTECHGSHAVRPVAAWTGAAAANDYCLACHGQAITGKLAAGKSSLRIDAKALAASVHPRHACTDCHAGFSRTEHGSDVSGGRNEHALAASRTCGRCHAEKLRQVEGSVHYALLRSGASGAPGCTDCHSAHEVAPKERYATLAGTPCRRCHAEIVEAYAGSMHGTARFGGGHLDAPFCSECHQAHEARGTASPERVRAACTGCHPQAAAAHASWLPNAKLHLEAVACAVCHAPLARRVVALRIVEEGTGRQLPEREVQGLLGGQVGAVLAREGGELDGAALWSFLRQLESGRESNAAGLDLAGRLELVRGVDAHRLAAKGEAVRRCENCHEAGGDRVTRVAVLVLGDQGRSTRYPGARGVLTAAASMVPIAQFYTLGSSRVAALDWLLAAAVLAGLAVPAAHITARRLASRRRRRGTRP
jgi:hypothetical protein